MFLIQTMHIADAYELVDRNDPSDVPFDQGKMCRHLVQCSISIFFTTTQGNDLR